MCLCVIHKLHTFWSILFDILSKFFYLKKMCQILAKETETIHAETAPKILAFSTHYLCRFTAYHHYKNCAVKQTFLRYFFKRTHGVNYKNARNLFFFSSIFNTKRKVFVTERDNRTVISVTNTRNYTFHLAL